MAHDNLGQHVLKEIINVSWEGIRFLCIDLDIDRRATIEWILAGGTQVEMSSRYGQTNDYVTFPPPPPPPSPPNYWGFELIAFRYCWDAHPTVVIPPEEGSPLIADVVDDTSNPRVNVFQSNGDMFQDNPLHTNWNSPEGEMEFTGLPELPMTFARTGIAAAFNNATHLIGGVNWFAPQVEWVEVEGEEIAPPEESDASRISQPLSIEDAPEELLVHFRRATSVTFRMRGLGSDSAGLVNAPSVGLQPEGGPIPSNTPPIEVGYAEIFDPVTVSFSTLRINWNGEIWRPIGAAHEPGQFSITFPEGDVPYPPGKMWVLFVRNNDPDY